MRSAATAVLLGAILLAAALPVRAAESTAATMDDETTAKQFAADIDRLNARDPQSPVTLNARFAYADFLTKLERDCGKHLDQAQFQLDAVKASPTLNLTLADGPAQVAHLEYQLHLARSSCGASAAVHDQELHAALASAQRAVGLYRDALDAVSMATMQFNVAVTYHGLGDSVDATGALRATIEMDREYGFADDAADNYRLLLQWTNEDAGPEQVAARMKDFPERTATLTFGWFDSDAEATLQSDVSQLAGAEFAHFRASRSAHRQVRRHSESWRVSYQLDQPQFETDEPPAKELLAANFANAVARFLTKPHDFSLTSKGDFGEIKSDFKFNMRAHADANALAREFRSRGRDSRGRNSSRLASFVIAAVQNAFLSEDLETRVAEEYNLAAGTWIGATLEQGVWYDMTASLSLPIAANAFVKHQMQFTYSRPVPCTPDSTEISCIEIILHAAPDPAILRESLDSLGATAHIPAGQLQLWSVTDMRLVTDPKTLQPYSREMRRHSYWSSGEPGPDHSFIESEKTVFLSGPITHAQ